MSDSGATQGDAQPAANAQETPAAPTAATRRGRVAVQLEKHPHFLRRLAAACFFLAALALTLISNFTPYLQTCDDQIARVGNVPTVHTCGPMSINTPSILILVIAAAVCLLPEWNVLEIPGILRVEKKVEEQGQRQEEALRLLQQISVSQQQNLTFDMRKIIAELADKESVFPPSESDQP